MVATSNHGKKEKSALTLFNDHLENMKKQMNLVLPKHISSDRMARLALTAFNADSNLRQCTFESLAASVLTAAQMGLEIGVGGHGWIIPYKTTATFVPGWMGIIELLNRTGRGTAWTGAVYEGDKFDWELGDSPRVKHHPTGDKSGKLTHVYAIGRIHGSDWPIIEVWTAASLVKHRDRYNKVGKKHYSFTNENNWEMYCRKVALLQVMKYLPKSVELAAAIDASNAADTGESYTIDGDFTVVPTGADGGPPAEEPKHDGDLKSYMAAAKAKDKSTIKSAEVDPDGKTMLDAEYEYWDMIAGAESEGECRALGAQIKRDAHVSENEKRRMFGALMRRSAELLEPAGDEPANQKPAGRAAKKSEPIVEQADDDDDSDDDSYSRFLSRVVGCDDESDAQGLAMDIQEDGNLEPGQAQDLLMMLAAKFA